jgi:Asp-tRNA(Asn)/Glu-tRNA(Gln) amidotransferase B subunit
VNYQNFQNQKENRYRNDYGIKDEDIESYILDRELGVWFEKVAQVFLQGISSENEGSREGP